jgi:hypothetical protein
MAQAFGERVAQLIPAAKLQISDARAGRGRVTLKLGIAELEIEVGRGQVAPDAFKECGWDVVAHGRIRIQQGGARPYERSASLWYTDKGLKQDFRWWEICYMYMGSRVRNDEPFALEPGKDADYAAAPIVHSYQFGATPVPIDDEHFDGFCDRWMQLLALAAEGRLSKPSHLPIP